MVAQVEESFALMMKAEEQAYRIVVAAVELQHLQMMVFVLG